MFWSYMVLLAIGDLLAITFKMLQWIISALVVVASAAISLFAWFAALVVALFITFLSFVFGFLAGLTGA